MSECFRCGKQNVDVHTCRPTNQWKAGFEYGLKSSEFNLYKMIKLLKIMEDKQLLEMFHDIDDIKIVQRIADCAWHFVETFEEEIENIVNGKSEYEEWREDDDHQRYRDIK